MHLTLAWAGDPVDWEQAVLPYSFPGHWIGKRVRTRGSEEDKVRGQEAQLP